MEEKVKFIGENRFFISGNSTENWKLPNIDMKNFISKAVSELKIQLPTYETWWASSRELFKEGVQYLNI